MTVRVRFAPSPTGFLHVGGARTALYNWLFARHMKGQFILRIEDTDEARSTDESMQAILTGLAWLGLDWDEGPDAHDYTKARGDVGPYFQIQRTDIYKKYLDMLLENDKAYPCFCSKKDLEDMRMRAKLLKRPPKYDGRCRRLTPEERKEKLSKSQDHVYRFARPLDGKVQFNDVVKGIVEFDSEQLDDFILLKSTGIPTFMFAGAIDDYLMNISHVIRGDDHLSNTPRQIQIFDALGWTKKPIFAHISMILGSDGARLSKRHGATSIEEFKKEGFLPEVMLNYLSLLGWSTSDSQQLFDSADHFKELVQKFELERCQKSPAVFDMEKLKWMNGVYIRKLTPTELLDRAWEFLKEKQIVSDQSSPEIKKRAQDALALEQEKLVVFSDAPGLIDFFFTKEVIFDPEAVESVLKKEGVKKILEGLVKKFSELPKLTAENTELTCKNFAKENGLKNGQVYHPARVSVSGRTKGPSLFHMLEVMGKETVLERINKAINMGVLA